jgi:hypothetical protein
MANTFDSVKAITDNKLLHIREIKPDGKYHRRVLAPDMDVSGENDQIQEQAEKFWTDEVKESWIAKKITDKKELDKIRSKHE